MISLMWNMLITSRFSSLERMTMTSSSKAEKIATTAARPKATPIPKKYRNIGKAANNKLVSLLEYV